MKQRGARTVIIAGAMMAFVSIVAMGAAAPGPAPEVVDEAGAATSAAGAVPEPRGERPPQQAAVLGYAACENCHEPNGRHDDETRWYREQDGDVSTGHQHANALNQIYQTEAEEIVAKLNIDGDFYDFVEAEDGRCASCHVTHVRGSPDYGVTCESCHGPGEDYLEPHKTEGAYQEAVATGMYDIIGKPAAWAEICLGCHLLGDTELIAAGHPSGDEWDITEKYANTAQHFLQNKDSYTAAQIGAAAQPLIAAIIAQRAPVTAAAPDPEPEPEPAPPTPEPEPDPGPTPTPPEPQPDPSPTPVTPEPEPDPTPVPPTPEPVPDPTPAPAPVDDPRVDELLALVAQLRSDFAERPAQVEVQVVDEVLQVDPLPRTPAGTVAAIQGRLVGLLRILLNRDATTPTQVIPEEDIPAYAGADASLLRLQQEVIALALEALRMPPAQQQQQQQ